jgi:Fuc2NAc and GlcNAc transferase
MNELLAVFSTAVAASAALTWYVWRRSARWGLVDVPNDRSSHSQPTPRGGGLAIVLTVLAAAVLAAAIGLLPAPEILTLAAGGAVVAAAGYRDDRHGLAVLPRFAVQGVAAAVLVAVLHGDGWSIPLLSALPEPLMLGTLVVGLVWSANLFNFMDGIDGIGGSQGAFAAAATALLVASRDPTSPWLLLPVVTAGACCGFLILNWPPARIFMGDVGSGFLGFWLAGVGLVLDWAGILSIWTSVLLGSVFIADATVTLVRRVARRERWHRAHRSHAYQQLAKRWQSHRTVTLLVCAVNMMIVLPLAAVSMLAPQLAPQLALTTLAGLSVLAFLAGAGDAEKAAT